jgi:phenylalanyl-tRNA synthetase beta subunit
LFLQELIFLPFKASVIVQERSHLPVVRRELSLVMEAEVSSAWVTNELKEYCQSSSSEGLRVSDVVLVNWYEGDSLPSGKKSLSYRFELQAMKKTPSEAEIQVTMDRILGFCRDRFRAELR